MPQPSPENVVNETTITGAFAPTASTPDQTVCVAAGVRLIMVVRANANATPAADTPAAGTAGSPCTDPDSGNQGITVQILGAPQFQCDPSLNCTQPVISTADGTTPPVQSVVVGQQIKLTTSALPSGITATSTTWTAGGTNIGGYTPGNGNNSVTQTTLNQPNLTTYWVNTGSSIPVTYQYCVNIQGAVPVNQCSLPANAAFTVDGPTGANVIPSDETVGISPDQSEMAWGIRFASSASPPSQTPGVFKWVQLVTSDNVNFFFQDGTSMVCTLGPGLDKSNPYGVGTSEEDGPSVPLDASSNEIEVTDSTQYQMYLMWDPETSSSIPVPLGYLPWTTSGDALYNSGTSAWSLNSGTSATNSSSFVTSNTYPIWSTTLTGTINLQTDCH